LTASPTSTTSPVNSWPMMNPVPAGSKPRYTCRSLFSFHQSCTSLLRCSGHIGSIYVPPTKRSICCLHNDILGVLD
jgi:hypothetical protein